ncbi:MAG: ribosome maturation factor RimM [Desulfocapsaceae bacterium]|nr:ribosome maturation factor RimM [Desulfocapsaceae bacterium]
MIDNFIYPAETYLLIGKVIEPHGLKGEIKIFSYAGQPENIRSYKKLFLVTLSGKISPAYSIEKCRVKGKSAIVRLASVSDRNGAEAITGMGVLILKEDLPQPGQDEFYLYQLEGLTVVTVDGRRLGTVTNIMSNGAQDLLVVQDNNEEYLIPILDSIILRHDTEKIVIAPPPGLLEINSGDSTL